MTREKRPLHGPKMVYYAPLPPSKAQIAKQPPGTLDAQFTRIVCKDAIGNFLNLPRAPLRVGVFKSEGGLNAGRRFSINDSVKSSPYQLILIPGTLVEEGRLYNEDGTPNTEIKTHLVKRIIIYLPSHIQVWRILYWLGNNATHYVDDQNNKIHLPGYHPQNLDKIAAVVTPRERKYQLRSSLLPNSPQIGLP